MFDVAIVGAGPAGNQTALGLARRGRRVVVIDYRERVGDKLCTGIVGRECVERYSVPESMRLGAARAVRIFLSRPPSVRIERPEAPAFIIDRVGFVQELAARARRAGAEYMLGRRVKRIERTRGYVEVACESGGDELRVRARAVVVASGFRSSLARGVGLEAAGSPGFAAQAVCEAGGVDEVMVFSGPAHSQGSFGWMVPVGAGRSLVGVLGRERPAELVRRLRESVERAGLDIRGVDGFRTWGVPLSAAKKTFADRALLVGDVAGHVKPMTGGGIYYSLRCGDLAAETLHEALAEGRLDESFLAGYEGRWKQLLGGELRMGGIGRRVYEALSHGQVDRLARLAASNGFLDAGVSFDRHSELVKRAFTYRLFEPVVGRFASLRASILG